MGGPQSRPSSWQMHRCGCTGVGAWYRITGAGMQVWVHK